MNLLEQYNLKQIRSLCGKSIIPNFKAGDSLKVHIKISEGTKERIQIFEGVCIARKNFGISSTFTVRKISAEEGVEKKFHLYSPRVQQIDVIKVGAARRAKLYYLRDLKGKATRIKSKFNVNAAVKTTVDVAVSTAFTNVDTSTPSEVLSNVTNTQLDAVDVTKVSDVVDNTGTTTEETAVSTNIL